jgi:hypothetical protein
MEIKILRQCFVGGELCEVGDVVTVDKDNARSLVRIGRAEFVSEKDAADDKAPASQRQQLQRRQPATKAGDKKPEAK